MVISLVCDLTVTGIHATLHSYTMHHLNTLLVPRAKTMQKLRWCALCFSHVQRTLQQLAKHCRMLIIATDNDREGESIGFEIIEVCTQGFNASDCLTCQSILESF